MPQPVLQAMVLADHVYQERTGKFIIAGTFSNVLLREEQRPTEEPPALPAPEDFSKAAPTAEGSPLKNPIDLLGGQRTRFEDVARQIGWAGSPYLYLALTAVHGTVPATLRFVNLADNEILIEAVMELTAPDPVRVVEYSVPMPPLPISKPGVYSLDLFYNEELLGSWRVIASIDHAT